MRQMQLAGGLKALIIAGAGGAAIYRAWLLYYTVAGNRRSD